MSLLFLLCFTASDSGVKFKPQSVAGKAWPAPYKRQPRKKASGQSFVCDVCGKIFTKLKEYNKHIKNVNHTKYQLKCVECKVTFDTAEEKKLHQETEHKDIVCDICGDVMKTHRLKVHLRDRHSVGRKVFYCAYEGCTRKFERKSKLQFHENTHLGLTPYLCRKCGKGFASKLSLKDHEVYCQVDEEDRQKLECDICGEKVLSRSTLSAHKRKTHLGHRYRCDECGIVFIYRASIIRHIKKTNHKTSLDYQVMDPNELPKKKPSMIASGPRKAPEGFKFYCEECGTLFSFRASLLRHLKKTNHSMTGSDYHVVDPALMAQQEASEKTDIVAYIVTEEM